ncbi:hypothetical protein Lal_00007192 [Lupinus albus]|nr:hypothetical protein Lal_00007192 [Lupinus albus]
MATQTKRQKTFAAFYKENSDAITAAEAIKLIKDQKSVKFDETLEVHFRLGVNPKMNDQQIRSTVQLPGGTGKEVRVAVVAKGEKIKEAQDAGADVFGAEELVAKISEGFLDFDKLVSTPDAMAMLSKLGKVLGPKGLMPNPKDGTVTFDVGKTVKELKAGKVAFRAEKDGGVVQMAIGKLSFDDTRLLKNLVAVVDQITKIKPPSVKGQYIKSVYLASTQGPSPRILKYPGLDLWRGAGRVGHYISDRIGLRRAKLHRSSALVDDGHDKWSDLDLGDDSDIARDRTAKGLESVDVGCGDCAIARDHRKFGEHGRALFVGPADHGIGALASGERIAFTGHAGCFATGRVVDLHCHDDNCQVKQDQHDRHDEK